MNDDRLRAAYARQLAAARARGAACPPPEQLLALVEKQGSEATRLATLDHAMSCEFCRRDLELLRSAVGAARQVAPGERAPYSPLRLVSPAWLAAAAALILTVGGVAIARLGGDKITEFRGDAGPIGVSPRGSVQSSEAARLVWRRAPAAVSYHVELLTTAGDSVFAVAMTADTIVTLPAGLRLDRGREYLWSVRANFSDGTQAAAAPVRFRIQP